MVEFALELGLSQARQILVSDVGSIVHRNELLPGLDRTGQILALAHRAHPAAVEFLLSGYTRQNPSTVSGNVSSFVGYWLRKAQKDIDSYIARYPYD